MGPSGVQHQRQGAWGPRSPFRGQTGLGSGSGVAGGSKAGQGGVGEQTLTMCFINQETLSPLDLLYFMETETGGDIACCCFYCV